MAEVPSQALVFDLMVQGQCPDIQQLCTLDSEYWTVDCGLVRPSAQGTLEGEALCGRVDRKSLTVRVQAQPCERQPVWTFSRRGQLATLLPSAPLAFCTCTVTLQPSPSFSLGTEIRFCPLLSPGDSCGFFCTKL